MTLQEYLKEKTELLSRSGVPEAENEAWVVLETVSGLTRSYIRFSFAKELAEVVSSEVFSSLEKTYELRSCGEPLAYIVGHAPFYDLEFSVGEGVLIPRFDTEILVETALKALGIGDFPFSETDAPIPKVSIVVVMWVIFAAKVQPGSTSWSPNSVRPVAMLASV